MIAITTSSSISVNPRPLLRQRARRVESDIERVPDRQLEMIPGRVATRGPKERTRTERENYEHVSGNPIVSKGERVSSRER